MKCNKHCKNCEVLPYCAVNDMSLYEPYDPCCPNLKPGREQLKEFEWIEDHYNKWDL